MSLRRLALLAMLLPAAAFADRGALTVGAGGGLSLLRVDETQAQPLVGTAIVTQLELRYALRHSLELELGGQYEPPATFYHVSGSGTLSHRMSGFGAHVGARLVYGMVWRPIVLGGLGWTHHSASAVSYVDSAGSAYPRDDSTSDRLTLLAGAGLEWVPGDNLAVSLVPRLALLVGSSTTWAITLPLVVSWSWYL